MHWAAYIWLALMLAFIWVEVSTVALLSIWFAAGALVAMLAAMLGAELWLQVVLFVVVSVVLLLLLRQYCIKCLKPRIVPTNVDAMIGKIGIVTTKIDNIPAEGQVKLNGLEWAARSTSGAVIAPGTQVKVDRIEGVKVFVTPVEAEVTV